MRDEFSSGVRQKVAARVGYRCSNPCCRKSTSGPGDDVERALNIGVAAHITAASPGGPRFDESLTSQQRAAIDNAIWLCHSCGALIDRDIDQFTEQALRDWKRTAENAAASELAAGTAFRSITASELRKELTVGELAAILALSEEFACGVKTNISVPAGDGWLNLDAAVVRGDDLVAIEIRECNDHAVPYFQIEHLIELGSTLTFNRFRKFVLYVAVVSSASRDLDELVKTRLEHMARGASCEVYVRMYRLNTLRAKYDL